MRRLLLATLTLMPLLGAPATAQRTRWRSAPSTVPAPPPAQPAAPVPAPRPDSVTLARLDTLLAEQRRQGAVLDSFVTAQRPSTAQRVLGWVWPVLGGLAALFVLLALVGNVLRRR